CPEGDNLDGHAVFGGLETLPSTSFIFKRSTQLRVDSMSLKPVIGAIAAAVLLTACYPVPPRYFGPQLASVGGEVAPDGINSPAFAVRQSPPGRPGYLDTIRYIDNGVKYIDPFAEFFISFDGQMCFRGLVNRQQTLFENYQNYWCIPPTAVNNVEALENNISYVNTVRLWCVLEAPQCARRFGFPNFPDESSWIGNSITAQTRPFREQRDAIGYLIYLMGGRVKAVSLAEITLPPLANATDPDAATIVSEIFTTL